MNVILSTWLLWVALQILLLLLAGLVGGGVRTNGLWIRIPDDVRGRLTADELAAVVAHEHGHRARLHAFKNLARRCCFIPWSAERAAQQELEADDWAAARGHAAALASAIRKLSNGRVAVWRARRLEGSPL